MGDYLPYVNIGPNLEAKICQDFSPTFSPSISHAPTLYDFPNEKCKSKFSGSGSSNCVLLSNGRLKCFGLNTSGELGYGDVTNRGGSTNQMGEYLIEVDLNSTILYIQTASNFACVVSDSNDDIRCWGRNAYGELGLSDASNRGDGPFEMGTYLPTLSFGSGFELHSLRSGGFQSCVISSSLTIKCWEYNISGQLGIESTEAKGNNANEMGNYLSYSDLGTNVKILDVSPSNLHTCIITISNSVKCFGSNGLGQLGYEDTFTRGDAANDMGNNLNFVNLGSGLMVSSLYNGEEANCIISSTQKMKCWGEGTYGRLGYGTQTNEGDGLNEMGEYLPYVNLGSGKTSLSMCMGSFHSCTLLNDYSTICWGNGGSGQLGNELSGNVGDGGGEMGDYLISVDVGSGRNIESLHCGAYHTCAVLNNDSYRCWGYNNIGQLGIGNILNQGDDVNEMGDYLDPVNLGVDVIVTECLDISPTFTPTITSMPSLSPSWMPTITSNSPTLSPSISFSPTSSFSPTFSPTLGGKINPSYQGNYLL